jgi:hypothetical protein
MVKQLYFDDNHYIRNGDVSFAADESFDNNC